MEAWGAMLQRRRDTEAASEGRSAASAAADDGAYDLRDVAVDVPLKKPQTLEAVLTSRAADGEGGALLVALGTSDGALHCYAFDADHHSLRWQATHKRVFAAGATFLDSWGVFLTLTAADAKLALYALPLESSVPAESGAAAALIKGISWGLGGGGGGDADSGRLLAVVDEAKHTALFAAHECAKVVCCLSKQGTLRVFDWTANRTLELRATHELPALLAAAASPTAALPALKLVVMGESHVFLLFKRDWCVLNIDSGRLLAVGPQYASAALALDAIACAAAVPSRQTGLQHHSHQLQDVFVAGKHCAVVVALAVDNEDEEEATVVDERTRANPQNVSDDRVRLKVERVLEFPVAPRAAFYHHPLLLVDHYDHLAAHNVATMRVEQTIPTRLLYGGSAALSLEPRRLASPSEFLDRPDGAPAAFFTAAAPFALQLLTMKPIEQLVKRATASGRLRDAVALCKLCPEDCNLSDAERCALFADRGLELFQSGEHRQAMRLFLESELDIMDVLTLYPRDLLPRSSSGGGGDGARTVFAWKSRQHGGARQELAGDALVQSLLALILLLRHKHDALARAPDGRRATLVTRSSSSVSDKSLEVIDTVLLKCLVLICEKPEHAPGAKRELMELVSRPNRCEMGEAEIFLRAHRQFTALLAFYATRKEHRKALELLEDLERTAAANEKAAAVSTSSSAPAAAPPAPLDTDQNGLQTSAAYMALTTEYLQRLGQSKSELVFEFSRRVLAVKPVLGLTIFTHRQVHEQKADVDAASVLSHLKTCEILGGDTDAKAADAGTTTTTLPLIAPRFVAIEYLTQVIQAGKVAVAPRLHDEVVYLLLDAISSELLQSGGKSASTGGAASRLTSRVSSQRGLVGTLRKKLMEFLAVESSAYHPERMLSRTPQEMVDERAALLSRLGRHHEVLQLYAVELKDAALAESYCNRCYDAKLADSSIYSALLRLYLRPLPSPLSAPPLAWQRSGSAHLSSASPFQSSEAVAAAVSLLNKYPERIDVPTALDLLPPDVPVASLAFFFRRVVECQVERFRNGQVTKQLAKMANFTVRQALAVKRKGCVTVWASHCCQACGKRLGAGTFVRLPGGALLHYACQPSSSGGGA